jgi:addiction module RelE/StbE family toxin
VGFTVVLSRVAVRDLAEIVEYIALDNPPAAKNVGHSLIAQLRKLEDFPRIGRIVPEFQIETLREIIQAPYRIVYQINDSAISIEVARFWHSARGTPRLGNG